MMETGGPGERRSRSAASVAHVGTDVASLLDERVPNVDIGFHASPDTSGARRPSLTFAEPVRPSYPPPPPYPQVLRAHKDALSDRSDRRGVRKAPKKGLVPVLGVALAVGLAVACMVASHMS